MSVTQGLQNAAYVIFFLMIIGGTFAVLDATGAMNAGMANVVKATRGKELLMIPICMIVFGCGSAFCGNFEEFLAFVPLVLACCLTTVSYTHLDVYKRQVLYGSRCQTVGVGGWACRW